MRRLSLLASLLVLPALASAQQTPKAVYTDPPRDATHPARMEVLHVPTGGVKVNGVAYLAAGAGVHPTVVLLHGLPGNEKNLDLAQAIRRAGWNAITFNYRGSWGSPGTFSFANVLADVPAVLASLRDPANAKALGIDTTRIVLAGHSMGGWATALTAANDSGVHGVILISAADMGAQAGLKRDQVIGIMRDNMESLAGVTAESMADELIAHGAEWRMSDAAPKLVHAPMLVVTSNDGLAPFNDALVKSARAAGNAHVTTVHFATDHSYSDQRIALESAVLRWLAGLK